MTLCDVVDVHAGHKINFELVSDISILRDKIAFSVAKKLYGKSKKFDFNKYLPILYKDLTDTTLHIYSDIHCLVPKLDPILTLEHLTKYVRQIHHLYTICGTIILQNYRNLIRHSISHKNNTVFNLANLLKNIINCPCVKAVISEIYKFFVEYRIYNFEGINININEVDNYSLILYLIKNDIRHRTDLNLSKLIEIPNLSKNDQFKVLNILLEFGYKSTINIEIDAELGKNTKISLILMEKDYMLFNYFNTVQTNQVDIKRITNLAILRKPEFLVYLGNIIRIYSFSYFDYSLFLNINLYFDYCLTIH